MSKLLALVCPQCGCQFERYPSQLKSDSPCCSKSCADANKLRGVATNANDAIRQAFADGYRATHEGRILAPGGASIPLLKHRNTGYWQFSARRARAPLSLHRFIAFQLYGDVALAAECIRHGNDNRDDNRFENILYGSRSENQFDIPGAKRSEMGVKRNRHKRQFSDDDVRLIRRRLREGWSLKRLRRELGASYGALANIRDGVTYRDVPDEAES